MNDRGERNSLCQAHRFHIMVERFHATTSADIQKDQAPATPTVEFVSDGKVLDREVIPLSNPIQFLDP